MYQRQAMQAKQRKRCLTGKLPVRAGRNPGPQFVGGEQPRVDQSRGKLVFQASEQPLCSPGRGMPVWLGQRGSADTGNPVHTQPSDRGGIPDGADNRGERLMIRAGIHDGEKYGGGPIRLPLLEKGAQVFGPRLARPRGRCNGHFQRIVAIAEQDPVGFERRRRADRFGPGQAAPGVVLQKVLGSPCWHLVLPLPHGRLLP